MNEYSVLIRKCQINSVIRRKLFLMIWLEEAEPGVKRKIVDGGANNNYCVKGVSSVVLGTLVFLGVFRWHRFLNLLEICLLQPARTSF